MDPTHIHLVVTHFPIIGTLIGIGILIYGIFSNNDGVKKAALIIFILMSLITIPAFLTGEQAEEAVENINGVSHSIIEDHEHLSQQAIWIMGLLGLFSIASLYAVVNQRSLARAFSIITLFISLGTFSVFVKVGNLGGQIRHSEIRNDQSTVQQQEGEQKQQQKRNAEEEDDD